MNGVVKTDTSNGEGKDSFSAKPPTQEILSNINYFRDSGDFCDVTFTVDGHNFPAHKVVLASFSPYFNAMFSNGFSESNKKVIEITSIDASAMSYVLDYGYGKSCEITHDNVENLLGTANLLQIPPLFDQCTVFLERNLNAANCLGIYHLGKSYHSYQLIEKAKEYALKNFNAVSKEVEFLELDAETLIDLIGCDTLNVPAEKNEVEVFSAVIQWLMYEEAERTSDLPNILAQVRLAHLPVDFLYDVVESVKAVRNSEACMRLIDRATKYKFVKNRRLELQSSISKRRQLWAKTEVMVLLPEYPNTQSGITEDGRFVRENSIPAETELVCTTSTQLAMYYVKRETIYLSIPSDLYVSSWYSAATGCHWFGMTELDRFLYCVGGMTSESGACQTVKRYGLNSSIWQILSPLPTPLYRPGVVTLRGMIYVVGGLDNHLQSTNAVQRYDPRRNCWTEVAPVPAKRGEYKACAMNDRIYACEFFVNIKVEDNKNEDSRNVYVYDPASNSWSSCAKLRNAFISGPIPFNGNLFVLTEQSDEERVLEKYDTASNTWKPYATFTDGFRPYLIGGPLLIDRPSTEYDPKGPLNVVKLV